MKKALLISKTADSAESVAAILGECGFEGISFSDGEHALSVIAEEGFDIITVITPLENAFGLTLAAKIAKSCESGLIVLVKPENLDEAAEKLADTPAFVMPKNVSKTMFIRSVKYMLSVSNEMNKLRSQTEKLTQKLDDVRLVDRAKCVLIEYLRISEAQAHRQIQKQAMDQRITQAEVARSILNTYES